MGESVANSVLDAAINKIKNATGLTAVLCSAQPATRTEAVTDLAIADGSPGQCYFALNTPKDAFDEFFNETEQEGKWVRSGPNESLDCYAYAEAGRILLEPDRKDRCWFGPLPRPVWAQMVSLVDDEPDAAPEPEAEAQKPAKPSLLDRFDRLNSRG